MFSGIGDAFMKMAEQIIADMLKMLIFKSLLGLFGGGAPPIGGMANLPGGVGMGSGGGLFQSGGMGFGTLGPNFGIRQYAKGGVVTQPQMAVVGEGGMNEAIVPLPDGKRIPVEFSGRKDNSGTTNITVNVDNKGNSNTEMSGDEAGKLGVAIDRAVKRVIMDERRAGGLLYSGSR